VEQSELRPVEVQKAGMTFQDVKDILNYGFATALIGLLAIRSL